MENYQIKPGMRQLYSVTEEEKKMKTVIIAASMLLSGCAAYQLQPLSAGHPASPEAVSAPQRQASKTLAYTRADIPSPRPMVDVAAAQHGAHEEHEKQKMEGGQKTVTGEGKVVATVPSSGQLVVEHGEIKGFMDAMTMGYRVEPSSLLEGLKSGDQVRFTIDVPNKTIVKIEKMK
jgi:Cu/Ag efflux protein CusF